MRSLFTCRPVSLGYRRHIHNNIGEHIADGRAEQGKNDNHADGYHNAESQQYQNNHKDNRQFALSGRSRLSIHCIASYEKYEQLALAKVGGTLIGTVWNLR
jgi:hypothetical protein